MSTQLQLDLPPEGPPPRLDWRRTKTALSGAGARTVYWAPVWLPLILLLQIVTLGLFPALAERTRLDRAERDVTAREDVLLADHAELERDRRKLDDPIWRERVRKSLRDPRREPLTLAGSRSDP